MGLLNFAIQLHYLECGVCKIPHAISPAKYREAQAGQGWFCPNGHNIYFVESEKAKLEKEIEQQKKRREWAETNLELVREQRDKEERKARAYKGVITKTRKRIGNGVCPCCNRTFTNLMNHMKTQHPKYKDSNL